MIYSFKTIKMEAPTVLPPAQATKISKFLSKTVPKVPCLTLLALAKMQVTRPI
jgi:hypothetical protein